ncbi:MAG TPA: triple tyrosine motif-containing protein, partial [Opitutaceae bacterium]|nr:triple tyrosine motif-containing protein [Opitutaceae bacterium]
MFSHTLKKLNMALSREFRYGSIRFMGIRASKSCGGVGLISIGGLLVWLLSASVVVANGWSDFAAGQPVLQVFKSADYQSDGRVMPLAQDHFGMMYIGSDALLQYDGMTWHRFSAGSNADIKGIAIDEHDRIWVGGVGTIGYFDRTPSGQLKYTSLLSQIPPDQRDQLQIWGTEVTSRGIVFPATNKVIRWNGSSFEFWPLPSTSRRIVSQTIGDTVYICHPETGLWRLANDKPELVVPRDPDNKVVPCFLTPAGRDSFLAVTSSGLARLDGTKLTVLPGDSAKFIRENAFTCAASIDHSTLAVGTFYGGIVLVNPQGNILRVIDRASGLPSQAVNGLFLDRERNLWAATDGGIVRLDSSGLVTKFGETNGLNGKPIASIASEGNGICVNTSEGVFALTQRINPGSSATFKPLLDLKLSTQSLLTVPQGLLSAGYRGIRLLKPDGTLQEVYQSPLDVLSLRKSHSSPERIYFVDSRGLSWLDIAANWEAPPQQIPIPELASSLAEDNLGNVWVGTYGGGAFRFALGSDGKPSKVTRFEIGAALPAGSGTVRVGTFHHYVLVLTEAGILAHNPIDDTFYVVPALKRLKKGLAVSNPDANGDVWLAAEDALTDGTTRPVVGKLTLDDHQRPVWQQLPIDELPAAGAPNVLYYQQEASGEHVLWIGGSESLLRVDLDDLHEVEAPLSTFLRGAATVASGGRTELPLFGGEPPRLPFARNHLEFDFAAPTYRDTQYVRYQTQLAGFDRDWTPANAKTFREFTYLSEGTYTFKVRAADADGRWSAPAAY